MCAAAAEGSGSGDGLLAASGRACLLLESGALLSRLPAATCGQAARSYSWTTPPRMSRRVIAPPRQAVTGWGIGWASCRPRCRSDACSDVWSGSPLVLVDDAAEDVATSNCAASASGDRVGDRVGELQAAMRHRLDRKS